MSLDEHRKAVMSRHKQLVAQRDAINREIDQNFQFFKGKTVRVKHSRGEFEAKVIRVFHDETMAVKNLDTDKPSTRLLAELARMVEDGQE
jgi:predicted methyltransferase